MYDEINYDITESQINDVISKIPGETNVEKILGSWTIGVYVACRLGISRETLLKMVGEVYDQSYKKVPRFPDIDEDLANNANDALQSTKVTAKRIHVQTEEDFR